MRRKASVESETAQSHRNDYRAKNCTATTRDYRLGGAERGAEPSYSSMFPPPPERR